MKYLLILSCALTLLACSEKSEPVTTEAPDELIDAPIDKSLLVEIKGNQYTEYYDLEKKKIKFQGNQDKDKERHGRWTFYFENGQEASTSEYSHGVLHGYSVVKHSNGSIYYHGEYADGKKIGVWKTFDERGKLTNEQDYGTGK